MLQDGNCKLENFYMINYCTGVLFGTAERRLLNNQLIRDVDTQIWSHTTIDYGCCELAEKHNHFLSFGFLRG